MMTFGDQLPSFGDWLDLATPPDARDPNTEQFPKGARQFLKEADGFLWLCGSRDVSYTFDMADVLGEEPMIYTFINGQFHRVTPVHGSYRSYGEGRGCSDLQADGVIVGEIQHTDH